MIDSNDAQAACRASNITLATSREAPQTLQQSSTGAGCCVYLLVALAFEEGWLPGLDCGLDAGDVNLHIFEDAGQAVEGQPNLGMTL